MAARAFQLSDVPAVNALLAATGWPQRSAEGWRWLAESPALQALEAPAGWVLEGEDGAIDGFVGNWAQGFLSHGAPTGVAASGFSLVVAPHARGRSRQLIETMLGQPGVFASYTLNANARSSGLYGRYGLQPFPAGSHDVKLSWVVNPAVCMAGRAWRLLARYAPGLAVRMGERLTNPRLGQRPRLDLPRGVAVLSDLRDRSRWADFWNAYAAETPLAADRSPAALRWRLADPDLIVPPLMLVFNRGSRITGFAMAMPGKDSIVAPPALEIIDLIALKDEEDAIPTLMQALKTAAPRLGAAKLRLQVVSPHLLERLGPWAGSARREGGWGHGHALFAANAPDASAWAPTPYDGDYMVCLRQPTVAMAGARQARAPVPQGRAAKA